MVWRIDSKVLSGSEFAEHYTRETGHQPLLLGNPQKQKKLHGVLVKNSLFDEAINLGGIVLLAARLANQSNEETIVHIWQVGNYVTERYGIMGLLITYSIVITLNLLSYIIHTVWRN